MIESKFRQHEIIEHYNNSWKLKLSRDNYSIGYLFGMMEDIKDKYDINEYQVSQTTLEQIFNNFASMGQEDRMKSDRKKTLKRRSTRQGTAPIVEVSNMKRNSINDKPD